MNRMNNLFLRAVIIGAWILVLQPHHSQAKSTRQTKIAFQYKDKDFPSVINELAAAKQVNVILPTGANAITSKLTLSFSEPLTIDQAWEKLTTALSIAGYTMRPEKDMYYITKNSKELNREPFPIYINVDPETLPDSDQRIRYLYYLANIKISETGEPQLNAILKDILPDTALIQFDAITNGLIITDKANNIKALMAVIKELDKEGFQEKIEIIKLHNSQASVVAQLFNENILKTDANENRYRAGSKKPPSSANFFSQQTKVIPEPRTNALIVVGRSQAVERIQDFIRNYIDVELESGESILHIYQLQYLDAGQFADVLQKIVTSSPESDTRQSKGAAKSGGPERFFEGVIIKADKPSGAEIQSYYGGNNLIIAARSEDWKRIKKLIEELDTPQLQVVIEVLIVDLTIDDQKLLASMFRNPDKIPVPGKGIEEVGYQSAHQLTSPRTGIVLDSNSDPMSVKADLLRKAYNSSGGQGSSNSLAGFSVPGTTVLSFADSNNGVWGLLQILKSSSHTKILNQPHVITTNNQKATVSIGQKRLVADDASASQSTTAAKRKFIDANLTVDITPRISMSNTVNLQVEININEFASTTLSDANRIARNVTTNANVTSGDVLALGGLVRVASQQSESATPLLSRIPVIGNLFGKRNGVDVKTNLTVFISPKIITPRLRGGASDYTKDYIEVAKQYSEENLLFGALRDPITRWFFSTGTEARDTVNTFLEKDELKTRDLYNSTTRSNENEPAPTQAKPQTETSAALQRPKTVTIAHKDTHPPKSSLPKKDSININRAKQAPNNTVSMACKDSNFDSLKEKIKNENNPLINS